MGGSLARSDPQPTALEPSGKFGWKADTNDVPPSSPPKSFGVPHLRQSSHKGERQSRIPDSAPIKHPLPAQRRS